MRESPTVSVVIPCYNGAAFLRETLDSVLAQSHPVLEIIVIDDGSTDDSAAIAESYGPPVRVIRQSNQGESVARNRGIDESRGEWIALLDADDIWLPEKLSAQLEATRDASGVSCVYSDVVRFAPDGTRTEVDLFDWHAGPNWFVDMFCKTTVYPSSAMFPAELGRPVRFAENVRFGEDMIFFVELRSRGQFIHVRAPLTEYRVSANQQTKSAEYLLKYMEERLVWFRQSEYGLSSELAAAVETDVSSQLKEWFERAYWKRDIEKARKIQQVFWRLFGFRTGSTGLIGRALYPRWVYRVRDLVRNEQSK